MTNPAPQMFLEGVRVLDLTTFLSGPFGTQLLSDMGAEVIKVEARAGDSSRHIPPHFVAGTSAYFHAVNRNKKSIQIDLKSEQGIDVLLRLVKVSDMLVHNFRPGVMDRLGLTVERLERVNPKLVSCSISGFGETGPRKNIPAYDAMIQAWAGGMSLTGHPGAPPSRMGIPIGDLAAGMYAALGCVAALTASRQSGRGAHIDVAMFDSQLALLVYQAVYYSISKEVPGPQGAGHLSIPTYRSFLCGDDAHVMVTANTEGMWRALCHVLDLERFVEDPRFATNAVRLQNSRELWAILEPAFAQRTSGELVEELLSAGVPAARVNTVADALDDEQTRARNMMVTLPTHDGASVEVPGNPMKSAGMRPDAEFRAAVSLGESTAEVLQSLAQLSEAELEALQSAGIVGPFTP